ncbi:MAG: GNAT family N-acetyltransferase [Thermoplasmata archaeon]
MEFRFPVRLPGRYVRLEPLSLDHLGELTDAGDDPGIWTYVRSGSHRGKEPMQRWISELLERAAAGTDLPFAVRHLGSDRAIGMTRFLNIRREDGCVEVGGSWYAPRFWRTAVNTESKYLLLRHAFEAEACHRVEFKTDLRNERSQRAIARLGAVPEGTLREHLRLPDGHFRSSVYYGLLASEWPGVRARLESYLADDATAADRHPRLTGPIP